MALPDPLLPLVLTDHDLIVRLDERVAEILKWTGNHDRRHARVVGWLALAFVSSVAAIIGSAVMYLLR